MIIISTEAEQTTEIQCYPPKGYEYLDTVNGTARVVEKKTGEIMYADAVIAPDGSRILTPEQQRIIAEKRAKAERERQRKEDNKELGKFYFVNSSVYYDDVSPEVVARLIFLGTYIGRYNSTQLWLNKVKSVAKEDLRELLGISDATFRRFWKVVEGKYMYQKDGGIYMAEQFFWKGDLRKNARNFLEFHRAHIQAIRNLYNCTATEKHRYLGYVFQMMPFINYEYNILCLNPDEIDRNKIEPLTLNDFCDLIGYSQRQRARLCKIYSSIMFDVAGRKEYFCGFFLTGSMTRETARIIINPRIIYRGSDWHNVACLEALMKSCDKFDVA